MWVNSISNADQSRSKRCPKRDPNAGLNARSTRGQADRVTHAPHVTTERIGPRVSCDRVEQFGWERADPKGLWKVETTSFTPCIKHKKNNFIFLFSLQTCLSLALPLSHLSLSSDEHCRSIHLFPKNHYLGSCEPKFRRRCRLRAIFGHRPKSQKQA